MEYKKLQNISYNRQVIYLTVACFFGLLSYPFTRTSAAPYFNEAFGSENLSWAMISSAILAISVVGIYNRLAKKVALLPLFLGALISIIVINALFGFVMGHHPKWFALVYYAWSDVYILILVEQFWSVTNTLFNKKSAKKYYGYFLTSAATGSLIGNYLVAEFSDNFGADNMIFLSSFGIIIFLIMFYLLHKSLNKREELKAQIKIEHDIAETSIAGGGSLVLKSRYLLFIALLVITTQIVINGSYFIFNRYLDQITNQIDQQSVLYGKAFLIIQLATIFLSVVATPLAMKLLGVSKTHFAILLTLSILLIITILSPQLALIAIFFIAVKSSDYSIFRAVKEIFYMPLLVAEKFQAKTFIDIFIYRFSKAIAALCIIITKGLELSILYLVALGMIVWWIAIISIMKLYRKLTL